MADPPAAERPASGEPSPSTADSSPPALEPSPLVGWSMATFHAALLVVVLLVGLHLAGAAGDLLSGLDTAVGVAVYLYLWAATWWTNRRWLDAVGATAVDGWPDPRAAFGEAAKWGGATGLLFFAGVFVVATAGLVVGGGPGIVPFLVLAGLVGAVLAVAVGAAVGVLFAALDGLLLRAAAVGFLHGSPEGTARGP